LRQDIHKLDFPSESFDIIWAEGAINVVGFERGVSDWKRLLKPGGCLVIHDDSTDVDDKRAFLGESGFEILDHFSLDPDIWWSEYCGPLEAAIKSLSNDDTSTENSSEEITAIQRELEMFHSDKTMFSSVFYITQLKDDTR